jgi:hypothetical protein
VDEKKDSLSSWWEDGRNLSHGILLCKGFLSDVTAKNPFRDAATNQYYYITKKHEKKQSRKHGDQCTYLHKRLETCQENFPCTNQSA